VVALAKTCNGQDNDGKDIGVSYDDQPKVGEPDYQPYNGRNLSYAGTFTDPYKATVIRIVEWTTGKIPLMKLVREYERTPRGPDVSFWRKALDHLRIKLTTPDDQIANIPKTGPVVVVANHPHGLVDGLILAELIGRVRQDYKILTRSLLTNVPEIQYHMLPVAFPHEENSVRLNLEMRKLAMVHLKEGGVVILFPAGQVATSPDWMGTAIETEWLPFTAKMILKSDAKVLPIYFPGQNSRLFQWANKTSITVRQGLLLHEIVHAMHKTQKPVIGKAIDRNAITEFVGNPRGLMAHLRRITLALAE
jgi:putative hemolysin